MDARLPDAPESVTDRQREVARLIAEGKTNPQIADALGITLDGAKYHVSELLGRLGLERREEVADWYRHHHGWRTRLRGLFTLPLGALALGGTVAAVTVVAVVAVIVATGRETTTGRLRAPGTIEEVSALPEAVQQSVLVALPDGSALLLGGWPETPLEKSDRVWRFDPRTNRWSDAGTMVAPLVGHSVASIPGGIVVAGGRTPSVSASAPPLENSVPRIYRLTPDGLQDGKPLPTVGPIAALAVRPDGSVDALVETRRGEDATSFHVRHWNGDAWEPITGSPYAVDDPSRQAVALPGGSFAVITTTLVAVIDPTTGSHIEVSLPVNSGLGAFPTAIGLPDGRLALFGGLHPEQWQAFMDATNESLAARHDLPTGAPTPTLPVPDIEAVDGVIIIDPATSQIDEYRLPSARAAIAANPLPDGRILLVGGLRAMLPDGFERTAAWVFDPQTGTSEELAPLDAAPLVGSTVTLADGRVLILGMFAESATSARMRTYLYQP